MISRALIKRINDLFYSWSNPKTIMLGDLDTEPTQSDKPSNHSSHDLLSVYRTALRLYKSRDGYKVSTVANTNSMEPLIDANCVVVLEDVQDPWEDRVKDQPFKPGDVVTYDSTVGSIIHVLKSKTTFLGEPAWILQGTNNFLPDMSKVLESQIKERLFAVFYCKQQLEGD